MSEERNLPARQGSKSVMTVVQNLPPGLENVDPKDFVLPRVAIAQQMSEVVKKQRVPPGSLYNTLTEEVYQDEKGKPSLLFIPILLKKNRIKWGEKIKDGAQHMSLDGIRSTEGHVCETECPFITADEGGPNQKTAYDWTSDPKTKKSVPPECTPYLNFLSLLQPFESPIPVALSFGSSSYVIGKKLVSMAMMAGGALFSRVYRVTTQEESSDNGEFYTFKVFQVGKPDEAFFALAQKLYPWVSGNDFKVDMRSDTAEGGEGEAVPF